MVVNLGIFYKNVLLVDRERKESDWRNFVEGEKKINNRLGTKCFLVTKKEETVWALQPQDTK